MASLHLCVYIQVIFRIFEIKCEIEVIENVQKFALRMCTKSWDSDYDNLLTVTNLPSLKDGRTQACLCHLFKIVHGITEFADAPITHQVLNYNTHSPGKQIFSIPRPRTTYPTNTLFSLIQWWLRIICQGRLQTVITSLSSVKIFYYLCNNFYFISTCMYLDHINISFAICDSMRI